MNIFVDDHIFHLQQHGGISNLWRNLLPTLHTALPAARFDAPLAVSDWYLPTYYQVSPIGYKSCVIVYDLISASYPGLSNRADLADIARAVKNADVVVAISKQTAVQVKQYFDRDAIVAYPGITSNYGHVTDTNTERFQREIGNPYLLVVGRRGSYKNVQSLYQAWRREWGLTLVCVSNEPLSATDRAFAAKYKDQVVYRQLDDTELRLAYAGAVALVYPSLIEGFGLPLLEAMACACPIICNPTMQEVVGSCAIFCDTTRPLQIGQAIQYALDPSIRVALATAGTARAKLFTWERMAAVIAEQLK